MTRPTCESSNVSSTSMNQKTPFYTPDNDTAFHLCGKEVAIRYLYESKNERTSPECVRMCVVTDELWENLRSQIGQRNGFWPGKFVWLISVCWTKNFMTHQYASERVLLGLLLEKSSSCNRGNDKGVHLTKKVLIQFSCLMILEPTWMCSEMRFERAGTSVSLTAKST